MIISPDYLGAEVEYRQEQVRRLWGSPRARRGRRSVRRRSSLARTIRNRAVPARARTAI